MPKKVTTLQDEIDNVFSEKALNKKAVKKAEEETEENQSPMMKLLKDYPIKVPKEGEKIEGLIIEIDTQAVYVDLGGLGTGVVYGKEVKDGLGTAKKLVAGDTIVAQIVDLENEDGYVELSIREAARDEAWADLIIKKEAKDIVTIKILDANKGGLMVEVNGITGFMPVSQLTAEHYPRVEDGDKNKIFEILKSYVGKEMTVCVLDAVKEDEKLIVSEKEAYKDKEKAAISELKKGDVIEGEISGVVDFGAFVKFLPFSKKDSTNEEDKLEGLVHISQLDWQLIEDPRDIVKVGDKVRAKIISIDETRISLSIRELKTDPWSAVAKKYKTGDIVEGKVHKINHFGAFVYLDEDIHGLAHVSSFMAEHPRKNIDEVINLDQAYKWQIMSLEPVQHRMGLKFIGSEAEVKQLSEKNKKTEKAQKKKVEQEQEQAQEKSE